MYCRFCGRLMDTYIGDKCEACQEGLPGTWDEPPADQALEILAFKALTGGLSEMRATEPQQPPPDYLPPDHKE